MPTYAEFQALTVRANKLKEVLAGLMGVGEKSHHKFFDLDITGIEAAATGLNSKVTEIYNKALALDFKISKDLANSYLHTLDPSLFLDNNIAAALEENIVIGSEAPAETNLLVTSEDYRLSDIRQPLKHASKLVPEEPTPAHWVTGTDTVSHDNLADISGAGYNTHAEIDGYLDDINTVRNNQAWAIRSAWMVLLAMYSANILNNEDGWGLPYGFQWGGD